MAIHILFVPGTFGSTVQYIVRQYNLELSDHRVQPDNDDLILSDGSMHNFYKTGHYQTIKEIEDYFNNKIDQDIVITSPIYPMHDAHANTIIDLFATHRPADTYIFIYADGIDQAEITMLAQYHKIFTGSLNRTLDWLCGDNRHNIVNWNASYTHWSQMQLWEIREWISMFYPRYVQEWIDAKQYIPAAWLPVSSGDILANTRDTLLEIIDHAGKFDPDLENEFDDFVNVWRSKQQYLIDEHATIKNIVEYTISNTPYIWEKLNVISEAIIQRRLRDAGYEIRCHNLNELPAHSIDLYQLLYRI